MIFPAPKFFMWKQFLFFFCFSFSRCYFFSRIVSTTIISFLFITVLNEAKEEEKERRRCFREDSALKWDEKCCCGLFVECGDRGCGRSSCSWCCSIVGCLGIARRRRRRSYLTAGWSNYEVERRGRNCVILSKGRPVDLSGMCFNQGLRLSRT